MKPFNLEEAKAGKPVQTRDGRPVKFVAHIDKEQYPDVDNGYRLLVVVAGSQYPSEYYSNGMFSLCEVSSDDLFMVPTKRTVYMNIYPDGEAFYWDSAEEARDMDLWDSARVGISIAVPVEIEE